MKNTICYGGAFISFLLLVIFLVQYLSLDHNVSAVPVVNNMIYSVGGVFCFLVYALITNAISGMQNEPKIVDEVKQNKATSKVLCENDLDEDDIL